MDLKIRRENQSYDEVNFSFRFNNLEEKNAIEIKDLLFNYNVLLHKPKDKDFYVILIEPIENNFSSELIINIIKKYGLNEVDYGFWVSITSEYGHCGGYIPKEISNLYRKIGGQLDFSVMIGE